MDKPVVAGNNPVPVELEAGKEYYWCACGRTSNQPFCDGSHKETTLTPVGFTASKPGKQWLCMCRQTKTPPFCDGSHKNLAPGSIEAS